DLTKCVPDITFGECVTAIKNWKNFDVNIQGSDVYMNYIESQLNIKEAINLSKFEIQYPRKRLKQSESFLLKFADFDSKEYTYYPVYVDVNGSRTSKFTQTDDTNEIKIQALPLPILYRSGVLTAFAIEDGQSKMTLLLYDGLNSASLNLTDDSLPLMLPDVYEKHWSQWLDFRIKSIGYVTQFICFAEEIKNLTTRSKVFMYN